MDDFASVTRNDALHDVIAAEIADRGPITFQRFMALALYHPTLGYYRSGKRRIGERGDYITSPHITPIFGAIVGRQLAEVWERLGAPPTFDLVEMGAGDARLARDVVSWAMRSRPPFAAAMRLTLVEPDAALRDEQRRTLASLPMRPRWADNLNELAPESIEGCFLSNELCDAFPVRLLVKRDGQLHEVRVGVDGGDLIEIEAESAEITLSAHLPPLIAALPEGARVEINTELAAWIAAVSTALRRGVVITFDYGYPAARLFAPWRPQGTLTAFYRHAVTPDKLAHVGEQDLTAHVDFTALVEAGHAAGLEPTGFTSQRDFLVALGIHEAVSAPALPLEETLARRRAVLAITDPAGLGRVHILAQAKAVDAHNLAGFAGSESVEGAPSTPF